MTQLRTQLVAVAALLLTVVFGACGDSNDASAPSARTPTSAPDARTPAPIPENLVRPDSPVLGPTDARVTMVEFLDPECESCRAAFPIVKQLLAQYPKDLRLVVRYFPLHRNSVLAAIATEAAGQQGKYAEMQELLFSRQTDWGEKSTPQTELFKQYAAELGLDAQKFAAALADPALKAKVDRDKADGAAAGVTGTPTFFVNGQWVSSPSPTGLRAAIEAALKE